MTKPHIQIHGVFKTHPAKSGPRRVLQDVSLDVARGERIALVGPNGSGKTTLLRILLGIEQADSGKIAVDESGRPNSIAFVPQDYRNALFPWFRLGSNLALTMPKSTDSGAGIQNFPSDKLNESYQALCQEFHIDLELEKYPYQLSGGEQQIFLLICALLANPALMVLDEPLSAVDFGRKRLIQQHLADWLHRTGATLIFASHDFEEAVLLADRAVVLAADSGCLKTTFPIELPWPRTLEMRQTQQFRSSVEAIIGAVL